MLKTLLRGLSPQESRDEGRGGAKNRTRETESSPVQKDDEEE